MSEDFPVYKEGGPDATIYDYLERLNKFMAKETQSDYDVILSFCEKLLVKNNVEFTSLCQIKNIDHKSLPSDKDCQTLLSNESENVAKKINVYYKFNKKKIEKHYKALKAKNAPIRKKKLEEISKLDKYKQRIEYAHYYKSLNIAYDYDNPFRSEMINFIRLMLRKIDYVLTSTHNGIKTLLSIHKNQNTRNTKKGMKNILLQQCGQSPDFKYSEYFKKIEPELDSESEPEPKHKSNKEKKKIKQVESISESESSKSSKSSESSKSSKSSKSSEEYKGNKIYFSSDSEDSEGIICEL